MLSPESSLLCATSSKVDHTDRLVFSSPPHQDLSLQMTILWVAMGCGFLKETVREINTTLIFVRPATVIVDEEISGVPDDDLRD